MRLKQAIQQAIPHWETLKSGQDLHDTSERILSELGNISINKLDLREIDRKKWRHLAPATRAKRAVVLSKVVRASIESGGRGITMPIMPKIKVNNANPEYLTSEEVESVRFVTDCHIVRDFILWQFHTGLRPSESRAVCWSDIQDGSVLVRTSKSGKPRRVPLSKSVRAMLEERRQHDHERVWCDLPCEATVRKRWNASVRKALGKAGTHNLSLYVLRHSFASKLVQEGTRIEVVRDLMGHADIKMTTRYAKLNNSAMRDAVESVF